MQAPPESSERQQERLAQEAMQRMQQLQVHVNYCSAKSAAGNCASALGLALVLAAAAPSPDLSQLAQEAGTKSAEALGAWEAFTDALSKTLP